MVHIAVHGKLPSGLPGSFVTKLANLAFTRGGGKGAAEASVVIVGDAEMRRLNRRHRGKDKVTDVLSFGYGAGTVSAAAARSARLPVPLGDIVVCMPQVHRQAERIGRAPRDEFALMVVHGVLHLMGFDHETVRQEREMFALQQDVLIRAGVL